MGGITMKRYDSYKDSGIDWIGEIPSHWNIMRIRNIIIANRNGIRIGPFGSSLTGKVLANLPYKVYGQWNVVGKDFSAGNGTIDKDTFKNLRIYEVKPKDILISMMGTIGKCAEVPDKIEEGIMDSHIVKIRLNQMIYNPRYFEYLYDKDHSNIIITELQLKKKGSIMDGLNSSIIKDLHVITPPLSEQQVIADYLDKKCAHIDKAITKRHRSIELLEELKQSVITQSVTRGLNPNVSLKDSGIDWIGKIPSHWERKRFKFFMSLINQPSSHNRKIGLENIESQSGKFIDTNTEFDGNGVAFEEEDVIYGKLRPYLQKVWLAEFAGNAVGDFFVFRNKKNSYPVFIKYLLLSDGFTKMANGSTEGAKMPRVASDFILSLPYYIPSVKEQQAIADYLDKKCAEIDSKIAKEKQKIELLQELKQSIITEAVTGKRKVM